MDDVLRPLSNEKSVIFSTGLLLQINQENCAIDLSKKITEYNKKSVKFTLDKVTHPPFVRLYETVLPSANVQTAIERIEKITQGMIPFHMNWRAVEKTDHMVVVWGEINDALKAFQKTVLVEVNDLREGFFKQKYIEERQDQKFTDEEEASFKKWGSPWADPYLPHMVIAKAHPIFEDMKLNLEWEFKQCLFRGVAVGIRTGQDFTHCYEINFGTGDPSADVPEEISAATIFSSK